MAQLSPSLDITAGLDSGTSARISRTGAGLRSLHWRGVPVVPDYPGDDRPLHAGAVLFPWAGRLPDGEWKDLLAENPEVADRLRRKLDEHNSQQAEPSWPWTSEMVINVDRDLSQQDQPDDEFAYWSN